VSQPPRPVAEGPLARAMAQAGRGGSGQLDSFIRSNGTLQTGAGGRNRFPATTAGEAILYSTHDGTPTGIIQRYAVYNQSGLPIKRVDLIGPAHGGVPTPHVRGFDIHTNPSTGEQFIQPWDNPRAAFPWEIP
jgi:hypothetical protein